VTTNDYKLAIYATITLQYTIRTTALSCLLQSFCRTFAIVNAYVQNWKDTAKMHTTVLICHR